MDKFLVTYDLLKLNQEPKKESIKNLRRSITRVCEQPKEIYNKQWNLRNNNLRKKRSPELDRFTAEL
jgi:hypothetical protein